MRVYGLCLQSWALIWSINLLSSSINLLSIEMLCLYRISVSVTLDKPQKTLEIVFIGTIFSAQSSCGTVRAADSLLRWRTETHTWRSTATPRRAKALNCRRSNSMAAKSWRYIHTHRYKQENNTTNHIIMVTWVHGYIIITTSLCVCVCAGPEAPPWQLCILRSPPRIQHHCGWRRMSTDRCWERHAGSSLGATTQLHPTQEDKRT